MFIIMKFQYYLNHLLETMILEVACFTVLEERFGILCSIFIYLDGKIPFRVSLPVYPLITNLKIDFWTEFRFIIGKTLGQTLHHLHLIDKKKKLALKEI